MVMFLPPPLQPVGCVELAVEAMHSVDTREIPYNAIFSLEKCHAKIASHLQQDASRQTGTSDSNHLFTPGIRHFLVGSRNQRETCSIGCGGTSAPTAVEQQGSQAFQDLACSLPSAHAQAQATSLIAFHRPRFHSNILKEGLRLGVTPEVGLHLCQPRNRLSCREALHFVQCFLHTHSACLSLANEFLLGISAQLPIAFQPTCLQPKCLQKPS